ncbi:alpha/beta fold hydrolase [Shinella curvata]|uniref:Alpha/beta fold hydrolase n=1 Tax=Shinella curvata TaxID=1817964 RepID=A0ABT8XL45_9HYPH|nr:alpha/beta fold hydrolase [Shinella curvata]MCJ8056710.1 alpha/beta fold hydrolase [Shinella curvata]MDO6124450.1 alpha/beta fold hydrolase [Shinella curvata]
MDSRTCTSCTSFSTPVTLSAGDGVQLLGDLWEGSNSFGHGRVIINPATGVAARYYHRYARFLAERGFSVLTYDYRGIGRSRPETLRGCGFRWRDWGELDFEAAVRFMQNSNSSSRSRRSPLLVIGHSIGGFLPGLAEAGKDVDRILTVGAQYAWWGDYARERRLGLFLKWHLAMPMLTFLCGYFPGKRIGRLEDLPAGVAHEWAFRGPRFESSYSIEARRTVLARMQAVMAPILAITVSDDELGTVTAVRRGLGYYTTADRIIVSLRPEDYGRAKIGHFDLFHDSHATGFWLDTLLWLRDGQNPWPDRTMSLNPKSL